MTSRSEPRLVPSVLVGKPKLYAGWLYLRENPDARPSQLGRGASTRSSEGSLICKQLAKLKPNMHDTLMVPDGVDIRERSVIKTFNAVHCFCSRTGLPVKFTTRELSAITGHHKITIVHALATLKERGIIEYEGSRTGVTFLSVAHLTDNA